MINLNSNLTPRQWATYRLIKERAEQGRTTPIELIIRNYSFKDYPDGYKFKEKGANSHDVCPTVWLDIDAINWNPKIEKIILFNRKGFYRLASSKEEVEKYISDKYKVPALRKLARASLLLRKARKDGQGKLLTADGNPIFSSSQAREFIESLIPIFLNEINQEEGNING